jgi:cytochrome P450
MKVTNNSFYYFKQTVFNTILLTIALTPNTPKNIFSLDTNESWALRRSLFRHPFSLNVLRHFEDSVRSIVLEMCNNLDQQAELGEIVELDRVFQRLAMDVISEVAFQYKLEGKFSDAYEKVSKSFELIQDVLLYPSIFLRLPAICLPQWTSIGKFIRIHNFLDELADDIFKNICKTHKEGKLKDNSFAKSILEFSQKPDITLDQVKSEIRLMFIAGFETTAHTLSFFFYSLAANPTVQLKVQESIDNWFMENDDNIQVSLMPPYVEAVLKGNAHTNTLNQSS